jgi:hypothetical protein
MVLFVRQDRQHLFLTPVLTQFYSLHTASKHASIHFKMHPVHITQAKLLNVYSHLHTVQQQLKMKSKPKSNQELNVYFVWKCPITIVIFAGQFK